MEREWFTPAEIVAARSPELPGTERGFNMIVERHGWRSDPSRAKPAGGRGRSSWLYHISVLPTATQTRLLLRHRAPQPPEPTQGEASKALWARYESLSSEQKAECARRLDALTNAERYQASGISGTAAIKLAAAESGVSRATFYNWQKMTSGLDRSDWLAALAPSYKNTNSLADCHPLVWNAITADWLRPEKPSLSSCYRRIRKVASKNGWLPIPSEPAIRRRIKSEIPVGVITLARDGRDKAKTLYPAQKRTRTHFHAMQAVNMDGHKFDVFVKLGDGRITRVQLLGLQDLYSGMILAWRLSETENKETVRLVIGDMVERHGIPEKIWLDNGRAFASKWISGRMPNRFRFTIRDEDPQGILVTLGVEIHWTTPYSGQSKPIERAWRDLAENIAKHPFCAGAYTGNSPDAKPENYGNAAIPIEDFRDHVAREIEEHNSRAGRRAAACQGRSFVETFKASLAEPTTLVRWPTAEQRSLWLLAADKVTAKKGSGEIEFYDNRYWSQELNAYAGKKLVVRFDPDRLQDAIKVYTLDDRLICEASCIAATGFDDADAARTHARDRGAYVKALKEQRRLVQKMSVDDLARLYGAEKPVPAAPMPPKVKRVAVAGGRSAPEPVEDFEESFSRGLRMLGEDADIIPFTPKRSGSG